MINEDDTQSILANKYIKICLVGSEGYEESLYKYLSYLQNKNVGIIYISTIKLAEELCGAIKDSRAKIDDRFYIIDTKSKKMTRNKPLDNCYFVDSPADLNGIVTGFSLAMKFLAKNNKQLKSLLLIFDNIDTLFLDNERNIVDRFVYNFFSKIRKEDIPAIIISREAGKDKCLNNLLLDLTDGVLSENTTASSKKSEKMRAS